MKAHFLSVLLLASSFAVLAERELRVVELKTTLAQPVLEVIKPHLPPGAGASAIDNKLLLNLDAAEWARIEPVIQALDQAPASLQVWVRIYRGAQATQRRAQWSLHAQSGTGVEAGGSTLYQTQDNTQTNTQQVRALSGQPAFIQVGEQIPYLTFSADGWGTLRSETTFKQTGHGFYVLPRLQGEEVQALINPEQVLYRNGRYQTGVLQTEVRGALGAWLPIGGSGEAGESRGTHYSSGQQSDWLVEVKIEKAL